MVIKDLDYIEPGFSEEKVSGGFQWITTDIAFASAKAFASGGKLNIALTLAGTYTSNLLSLSRSQSVSISSP